MPEWVNSPVFKVAVVCLFTIVLWAHRMTSHDIPLGSFRFKLGAAFMVAAGIVTAIIDMTRQRPWNWFFTILWYWVILLGLMGLALAIKKVM